jgi:selenoprotein W-related protein
VRVTQELLTAHQHDIESLTLVTGSKGVFDVVVDGDLIWSKADHGRQANPGEVLAALDTHLS